MICWAKFLVVFALENSDIVSRETISWQSFKRQKFLLYDARLYLVQISDELSQRV